MDFSTLSYRELQQECKKRGLPAGGTADVLKMWLVQAQGPPIPSNGTEGGGKPKAESKPEDEPPTKRRKKDPADDLICPINLNLPIDPVMAEDGRVYERSPIEQYIKSEQSKGVQLKSPITKEPMGSRVFPAIQTKNTIETLVENGVITGPAANDWKQRIKQKNKMDDLLEKAGQGDLEAMEDAACNYDQGNNGFPEDNKQAYKWYEKAFQAGSVLGMTKIGELLVLGIGVEKNTSKGLVYLGMAEGRGSDFAAAKLGMWMADGNHGLPGDKAEGRRLLEKALSGQCWYECMGEEAKDEAQAKLVEIANGSP